MERGSQHEIDIHPGKVVIYNPGTFPSEFSPEDFVKKNLSSIIRNELIAKVLYLCHDIESFGSGFKRVYALCNAENVGCSYEKTPIGFSFVFLRNDPNMPKNMSDKKQSVPVDLTKTEKEVYRLLQLQPNLTREELSIEIAKSIKTVQRTLEGLRLRGLISRVGTSRKGYWEITQ